MLEKILTLVVALAIGAAGGSVFYFLHLPLPWTLGAILTTAAAAIMNSRFLLKTPARNFVRPVVGVLAGSTFSPELAGAIASWWPAIALLIAYSLVMLTIGYAYFRLLGGYDKVTAFFASAPGGLGEITLLGSSLGGDIRRLVMIHLIRMLSVIFLVPFVLQIYLGHPIGRTSLGGGTHQALLTIPDWILLTLCGLAGFFVSRRVKFPGSPMILPMLFSMVVHVTEMTQAAPPPWLVAIVQVVLGSVIGARFAGLKWSEVHKVLFIGSGWALVLIGSAAAAAYVGTWFLQQPLEGLLLALAPAGMVEMTLITFALGMETAFVVTCQLCRILFVLLITPLVFKIIKAPPPPPEAD
jgi:membrane AbrB-like protein